MSSCRSLTCTDAHYKPSHDDDLIGLRNFADPHHHRGDDGEDVVEEEGALPVTGLDGHQGTSHNHLFDFKCNTRSVTSPVC